MTLMGMVLPGLSNADILGISMTVRSTFPQVRNGVDLSNRIGSRDSNNYS